MDSVEDGEDSQAGKAELTLSTTAIVKNIRPRYLFMDAVDRTSDAKESQASNTWVPQSTVAYSHICSSAS